MGLGVTLWCLGVPKANISGANPWLSWFVRSESAAECQGWSTLNGELVAVGIDCCCVVRGGPVALEKELCECLDAFF
jgi:hypothetical protein